MSAAVPIRSTVADVDLDALVANYQEVRRRSGNADVIAVVKDDAYGHGVEGVAETLVDAGVAMLAVFTMEEALHLRDAGIRAPLLVFSGAADRAEADVAVAVNAVPVVWDVANARLLDEAAAQTGRRLRVHFKVDTGLTRLGAPAAVAAERYRAIRELPHLEMDGIFTHLATADEADLSVAKAQLDRFADVLARIERPRYVHALASAGVAAFGQAAGCNAVRPGLSLHGLHAAPHLAASQKLRPTLEWRSRVLRVADVKQGSGVAYGHEYHLPRDGRIATAPVGYGDGLTRPMGRRAHVLVGGRALPIAGRVSMDLITLDVTDVPEVHEGDEVVLIGPQGDARQSAEDLAQAAGTISHEVVTGIRRRVPRRYHRGGRVVAQRTLAGGYVRL